MHVDGCMGMHRDAWDAWGCMGMYGDAQGCVGMHSDPLRRSSAITLRISAATCTHPAIDFAAGGRDTGAKAWGDELAHISGMGAMSYHEGGLLLCSGSRLIGGLHIRGIRTHYHTVCFALSLQAWHCNQPCGMAH